MLGLLSGAKALPVDPSVVSTSDAGAHVAVRLAVGDGLEAGDGDGVLVFAVPQVVSNKAESAVVTPVSKSTRFANGRVRYISSWQSALSPGSPLPGPF